MAHGAAPVVLDTPVAREMYGPAARYVAPGPDARDRLAADLRISLVSPRNGGPGGEAPAVLSRYDWSRTAADTLAALEDAAGAR